MQLETAWLMHEPAMDALRALCESVPESVLTRPARKVDGSSKMTMRGSVAIIAVNGVIFPTTTGLTQWLDEIIGVTTLDSFALDLQSAIDNPNVSAVVLNVNSPGGLTTSVKQIADMVYEARSRKPVETFVQGLGASAGYFFPSSASRMTLDPMALVGSIGTVFSFSLPGEKAGQYSKSVEIVSDQSPMKRADPTTEEGKAEWKRLANELTDVFIETVSRNRGVSRATVLSDFGRGGLRVGSDAVRVGMADAIGSLEAVIERLGRPQSAAAQTTNRRMSMSKNSTPAEANTEQPAITAEEFEALKAKLSEVNGKLAAAETAREAAEIEKKTAQANATVDGWERDGKLSGNATAKVRELYVAASIGTAVTAEQIAGMVDALPKFDTTRVSANVKPADAGATLTADDFLAADKGNHSAKNKIDAHVRTLVGEKKTYTAALKEARAAAFAAK